MCNFVSMIVSKGKKVFWLPDSMSHTDIMDEFKLPDDKEPFLSNFQKIEITPIVTGKYSRLKKDWKLSIDDERRADWFSDEHEAVAWIAWKAILKKHFFDKGKHEIKNKYIVCTGNSSVEAWDNSSVEAQGNSSVEAQGNSSVKARDNSSVKAWGNSSVEAWDNSSVKARNNSSVEAWDNSSVEAQGNSSVKAWGNSVVRVYSSNAKIELHSGVVMNLFNKREVKWK